MSEYKLSEEVAQDQLNLLLDHYDIDVDFIEDSDVKSNVSSKCKKIIKAIRRGYLEIDHQDSFTIKQHLKSAQGDVQTLEYREIEGKDKIAMNKRSENDGYGRVYEVLGSMSGIGYTGITRLKGYDLSLAESLGIIFLQS